MSDLSFPALAAKIAQAVDAIQFGLQTPESIASAALAAIWPDLAAALPRDAAVPGTEAGAGVALGMAAKPSPEQQPVSVASGGGLGGVLPNTVRYEVASGATLEEMRDAFIGTPTHQAGDARLVWANEGDLGLAHPSFWLTSHDAKILASRAYPVSSPGSGEVHLRVPVQR